MKEKIKFDIMNSENDLNWEENLPKYQKVYNDSFGFLTPFEVSFARPSNRLRNKLFLGQKRDFEVLEENVDEANYDNPTELEEELSKLASERDVYGRKLWMLQMTQHRKSWKENWNVSLLPCIVKKTPS